MFNGAERRTLYKFIKTPINLAHNKKLKTEFFKIQTTLIKELTLP